MTTLEVHLQMSYLLGVRPEEVWTEGPEENPFFLVS